MKGIPDPATLTGWRWWRNQSRTNLFFLCRRVLGYKDVCDVHFPIINNLQKFEGGKDSFPAKETRGKITLGTFHEGMGYYPAKPLRELEGTRKTLTLVSRGHLKTSICTIAHSVQWIINYPDIRLLLSSATDSQVKKFLDELKKHFQFNETFRFLFPEFCPQGNVKEFGNQEQFTVPCRKIHRKEPTVSTVTVGSVMAGGHFDVIKNDDIVDKENVRTVDQIAVVESHVTMLGPLIERYNVEAGSDEAVTGWMDFTGTTYHYSDIYMKIREHEEKKRKQALGEGKDYKPEYRILVMPATKDGISIFDPKAQSAWPQRFPIRELQRIYQDPLEGGSMFMSQYMLDPRPDGTGLIEDVKRIVWIPKDVISKLYARLSLAVTVDLAGMENAKNRDNDYTVLTLAGWDRAGALYALEIHHGRPNPFQVIETMFDLYRRHPRIRTFKIEKEMAARVLKPFLERECAKRGIWLPTEFIPRDNQTSKEHKIRALMPWFQAGIIRFSDAISCKDTLEQEIIRFPKWHDDILDTLRDQMETRDGGVVADAIPTSKPLPDASAQRFMGFGPGGMPMFRAEIPQAEIFEANEPKSSWDVVGCL